uniref:Uncharacterized protein n=1 Tax=Sphenodon punctatus TaxID=8508 RepID=A0A8D0HP59_SPHPU
MEEAARSLEGETTCPICLELLREPVITDCGHNFCRACLALYVAESGGSRPSCPQCRTPIRPGGWRPNRQLANVAEIAAQLGREAARRAREEPPCPLHREPLRLFCESHQRPLCLVCRDSRDHAGHTLRPLQEAARDYTEKLQSTLSFLQQEKEEFKPKGEERSDELLRQMELERQKVLSEFKQLRQFLVEQEGVLLGQLGLMDNEISKRRAQYVAKVSEKASLLSELIPEVERKCQQPPTEFLKDVGSTLSRCERVKAPIPEPVSPELEKSVRDFSACHGAVAGMLAEFQESLRSELDKERAHVILDPETASPHLLLSADGKSVTLREGQLDQPDNPKRFVSFPCVLGSEGFAAGRHYWELEVGGGDSWAVGAARESVKRKGPLSLPMEGVWALRLDWNHQYVALTLPPTPLSLEEKPRKIRVHLDHEEGQVTFYNAETMGQIFTFTACFGEKIFPFFWLWSPESRIQLCS